MGIPMGIPMDMGMGTVLNSHGFCCNSAGFFE